MNRMDAVIAEMEHEAQQRTVRAYSYTRQRLDRNTEHTNKVVASLRRLRLVEKPLWLAEAGAEAGDRVAAAYWDLNERIEQLTLTLVHAGVLPWGLLHELLHDDVKDQYGTIPGCRCGTCPAEHLDRCACRDCRAAAAAAEWNTPEAIEQRRLVREFLAEPDE